MTTVAPPTVRAALVGGPMYDPLYDAIPAFEATGWRARRGRRTAARIRSSTRSSEHAFESGDSPRSHLHAHQIRALASRVAIAAR